MTHESRKGENQNAKGKGQNAKGKSREAGGESDLCLLSFAFCILPLRLTFYLLASLDPSLP
jgi:hypothetical protein